MKRRRWRTREEPELDAADQEHHEADAHRVRVRRYQVRMRPHARELASREHVQAEREPREEERDAGLDETADERVHARRYDEVSRWIIVTDDCTVGIRMISATLTRAGRVTAQRTASATSSAVSGAVLE